MNRPLPAPASDVALLVSRVILAVVMFAHGYQKLFIQGIGKTTDGFQAMNIPLAIVSASFVTALEVAGSILLLAGALTTVVCALFLFEFVGAAALVHLQNGLFVQNGGVEYVLVILAFFTAIAAAGPGRFSVDTWMRGRQTQYQQALAGPKDVAPPVAPPGTPSFGRPVTQPNAHASSTGSFTPALEPARRQPQPAQHVRTQQPQQTRPAYEQHAPVEMFLPAPSAPLSFAPTVPADAPMADPRPFVLPAPFAPEPGASAPGTEALPRRSRPAHASR